MKQVPAVYVGKGVRGRANCLVLQLNPVNSDSVFLNSPLLELKITPLEFALQLFTIDYFELPAILQLFFYFLQEYEIAGFNCTAGLDEKMV